MNVINITMDFKILVNITAFLLFMHIGAGFPVAGFASRYPTGKTYKYQYSAETLINEPDSKHQSQAQKDVGIKFTGVVELTPVWNDNQQMIVQLSISNPHAMLESVSRKDLQRTLKVIPKLPIYFQWSEGKVGAIYTAAEDSTLSVNIKKGIISLFQLVNVDKERKELDACGMCTVKYVVEKNGEMITKTKTSCTNKDSDNYFYNVNPLLGLSTSLLSETRYTIKDDLIQTAQGVEMIISRLNMKDTVATSVINRQEMTLQTTASGPSYQAKHIPEVIKKIKKAEKIKLHEDTLETKYEQQKCAGSDCPPVSRRSVTKPKEIIEKYREFLLPSNPAKVGTARAVTELVDALRYSSQAEILDILKDEDNLEIVPALIDAVTAAQTKPSQDALMSFLNFNDPEDIELPERFLLATAFSTHPSEHAIRNLLNLFKKKVPNDKLRESLGEGLGALIYTYCKMGHCDSKVIKESQKAIITELDMCTDKGCKAMYLYSLMNAGIPETVPLLLKYLESSHDPVVNEVAVKGLRRMGKTEIAKPEVREVMKRVFHQTKRGYDTAVRSNALAYLLQTKPTKEEVRAILLESTDPSHTDYSMYIQSKVLNVAEQDENIRNYAIEILKEETFKNWDFMALKGKSFAFTGDIANTKHLRAEYLMYGQNSKAGIMKRSGLDVDLISAHQTLPVYKFGIFAAGLEGLLGKEVDEGNEEIQATAGISLDLMDVSLRPITFFEGSTGLMSAVWSAPSEPMSALQANFLFQDHTERFHLQNGLVMELDVRGVVSMDLSGSLSVSLWNKNSQSLILSSGALYIQGSLRLATSSFRSGLHFTVDGASVINFQSDVDFYDGIKTCLQMYRPDVTLSHQVEKFEYARGFKKGYIARITRKDESPAVCYPLPKPNNEECRQIFKNVDEEG